MEKTYRIQIQGHLADHWSAWFDGLTISRQDDGTTFLTGPVVDQAALHGLLAVIRDLGLPLLAVHQATDASTDSKREDKKGGPRP